MTRSGDKINMTNKLDWRLISSSKCAVDSLCLKEYDYYMRYKEPENSIFDTLETGLLIQRKNSNPIMYYIWFMTFVALMSLDAYFIYDNIVDKVAHVNTLYIIVVLCLSATTFMVPK